MNFFENFWDIFWWFFTIYAFFGYMYALFAIIGDIFRDHALNGWLKAIWLFALVFIPFLTVLVYLIARGNGMTQRSMENARQRQAAGEAYIRSVATSGPTSSPSDEISKAKALLDDGTITATEFAAIKAKVAV
ncbi:SHOCT domain-containing protein [Paenarthrobacter sp. NPDC056912]|uniref:SHOCT domain-containing protein n=1 Tax=Paenarthrobacter sp. NPDC056912 TaxID=3345965 RepID=UPI00366BFCD1